METRYRSITQKIKLSYKKRIVSPILYIVILAILWSVTPISELALPIHTSHAVPFENLKDSDFTYITTTLKDLHFTGYTQKIFGYTNGYYYYTFDGDNCILALLAPDSCESGLPDIKEISVHVRIIEHFRDYAPLSKKLAADLGWTAKGIQSQVPDYLLSEPGFHKLASWLLVGFYFASAAYAVINIIVYAAYILFPQLSPTCRILGLYGNAKELLAQAENELALQVHPADGNIYITENFFISFTGCKATVVPIHEITWIYKHSTLHKFLWKHYGISYTLHITANKRLYLQYPGLTKPDIDSIIGQLCGANPAITAGFKEPSAKLW